MPWKKVTMMEEVVKFSIQAESGRFTLRQLCLDFGISRKTGYKWLRRYRAEGLRGLRPRSRRPVGCKHGTQPALVERIVAERKRHPTWGPKKLREVLREVLAPVSPPSLSTLARVLCRYGLTRKRRRKPGVHHPRASALTEAAKPNEVWTVDFKGWFVTKDGRRCDPLTVCDRYSRYLLCCEARPNQQYKSTLRVFKALLRRRGLPEVIRVDNGPPFASYGLGRLSRLSAWWVRQGIRVEFIRPAHPQDNGAHERMHRDLKAECTQPASANLRAQRRRLERWRQAYHERRPHEALSMRKPAELYQPSPRRLREKDKKLHYPAGYLVRKLSASGQLRHEGRNYHVGEALAGERVGLRVNPAGQTELYFANVLLGQLIYDPAQRLRPMAYVAALDHIPLAKTNPKPKPKV